MEHHDGFHKNEAVFPRKVVQPAELVRPYGGGLFADHVFAVREEQSCLLVVQGIRTCDINRVHAALCKCFKVVVSIIAVVFEANSTACERLRE